MGAARGGRSETALRYDELASFHEEQRPHRSNAASHVGAAILAHVARSGRSDAALR